MLWFIICSQTQPMCSLRKLSCEDEVLLELEDVTEGEKSTITGSVFCFGVIGGKHFFSRCWQRHILRA